MLIKEPSTIQLDEQTETWIEAEAKRTGQPKETIIADLIEETVRVRRFPGIAFRGRDHDRRAWLLGTGLDIWEVIESYKELGSLEQLLEVSDIPESKVRLAIAYYDSYTEEIDREVAGNQLSQEEWHQLYPTIVPKP